MAAPPTDRTFAGYGSAFRTLNDNNWQAIVGYCTRALSDPKLLPTHNLRKANLMRARAVAYLGLNEHDKALADVDAAEAAGAALTTDPLYVRSMGASLAMVRAAIWSAKGDLAKSLAFAQSAADARPYSSRYQSIVSALLQRNRIETIGESLAFARLLPVSPDATFGQMSYLTSNGRFAAVAKFYPRLKLEFPNAAGPSYFSNQLSTNEETLLRSVFSALDGAYAFAATRDVRRARQILAELETGISAALKPPPVVEKGPRLIINPRLEAALRSIVEQRTMMINARIAIEEKQASEALKAIVGKELPTTAASVEFLTALRDALPEAQRALAPDPTPLRKAVEEAQLKDQISATTLRQLLPAIETGNRAANYKKANTSILPKLLYVGQGYAPSGFKSKRDETTGITTVEYLETGNSADAVEELTLLHAADLARQQGKAGLIIIDRRDFSRTLTTSINGSPTSSRPAGFKTELDVRFVDPAALPADLALEGDRVLRADKVYSELARIYIPGS